MSETNTNQNRVKAKARFLIRRRKTKNWSGITLENGEFGLVTDSTDNSKRVKIGDGVTVWEELPWLTLGELNFNSESPNAQSGIAVSEAVNPKVTLFEGNELGVPEGNQGLTITNIKPNSQLLKAKVGDLYNQEGTLLVITGKGFNSISCKKLITYVDSMYNPESEYAQSGVAVAEAVKNTVGKKTKQGGEIFNDYENNKAVGKYSSAGGTENQAGTFTSFFSYVGENQISIVTDSNNDIGFNIGDRLSLYYYNGGSYTFANGFATITDINFLGSDGSWTYYYRLDNDLPNDFVADSKQYVYSCDRKVDGVVVNAIGDGSAVFGVGNKAIHTGAFSAGEENIADGKSAMALGRGNFAGYNAIALGRDNEVLNHYDVALGRENIVKGYNALAAGFKNLVNGQVAIALGQENTTDGDCSLVFGLRNAVHNTRGVAGGSDSVVNGDFGVAIGNQCIAGEFGFATGYLAKADNYGIAHGRVCEASTYAVGLGDYCKAKGDRSVALGYNCEASGAGSVALGRICKATNIGSIAIGTQLRATGYEQVVLGSFNAENNNAIFILGNGTSENDRKNALEILKDGGLVLGGVKITPAQLTKLLALLDS